MNADILIALLAVVIPVLTYFAGVYRTEKRLNTKDSKDRIEVAVNRYLELWRSGKDTGWSAALKSGFGNLANDTEIRQAAKIIEGHGVTSPIATDQNIESVNLKVLFQYVAENKLGFSNTPLDVLIRQANA